MGQVILLISVYILKAEACYQMSSRINCRLSQNWSVGHAELKVPFQIKVGNRPVDTALVQGHTFGNESSIFQSN